jgi:hypothetical protein
MRVAENTVVRRVFGLRREEVMGGLRKLPNECPHNLYYSQNNRLINSEKRKRIGEYSMDGTSENRVFQK